MCHVHTYCFIIVTMAMFQLMTEERQVTSDVHHNDSSEDEEIVSIRLNSELNKQQQLYEELKIKTQQLKQLQQVT